MLLSTFLVFYTFYFFPEWKQSQVKLATSSSEGNPRGSQTESEGAHQKRECRAGGTLQNLRQVQLPDLQTGWFSLAAITQPSQNF